MSVWALIAFTWDSVNGDILGFSTLRSRSTHHAQHNSFMEAGHLWDTNGISWAADQQGEETSSEAGARRPSIHSHLCICVAMWPGMWGLNSQFLSCHCWWQMLVDWRSCKSCYLESHRTLRLGFSSLLTPQGICAAPPGLKVTRHQISKAETFQLKWIPGL